MEKRASGESEPGFISSLARSFAYSAFQAPLNGVVQLYDHCVGTNHLPAVQIIDPCKEASFGSANWHAQQIGAGFGTAVDFIAPNGVLGIAGRVCGGIEKAVTVAPSFTKRLYVNAATGFVYDGVFHESNDKTGSFFKSRFSQAITGATTFSLLGAASDASCLAKFSQPVRSALAGIPAGVVNTQLGSILSGHGFAGWQDTAKNTYGFFFTGAALGLMHPKSKEELSPNQVYLESVKEFSEALSRLEECSKRSQKPNEQHPPQTVTPMLLPATDILGKLCPELNSPKPEPEWHSLAANNAWRSACFGAGSLTDIFDRYQANLDSYLRGTEGSFYRTTGDFRRYIGLFRDLTDQHKKALRGYLEVYDHWRAYDQPTAFELIEGLKTKAFVKALEADCQKYGFGGGNYPDNSNAGRALRLVNVFGNGWHQWSQQMESQISHLLPRENVTVSWLPLESPAKLKGLGPWLLKHTDNQLRHLREVAENWSRLSDEQRKLDCHELIRSIRASAYEKVSCPQFAEECAQWKLSPERYLNLEKRFLASQQVPSPFPLEKSWQSGNLSGRFLPRSDVRGLFLGEHTDCCQYPGGVGEDCAFYGQESPNSGFFVVEDKNGRIVAQSWAWVSADGGICFDNIEAKLLGQREADVIAIYEKAADDLVSQFHTVTTGVNNTKVKATWAAAGTHTLTLPDDYVGYKDSNIQFLLAPNRTHQFAATDQSSRTNQMGGAHIIEIPLSWLGVHEHFTDNWDAIVAELNRRTAP